MLVGIQIKEEEDLKSEDIFERKASHIFYFSLTILTLHGFEINSSNSYSIACRIST